MGSQDPPGRKHAGFPISFQPQPCRPFALDELLPVFGANSAGYIFSGGVLLAGLVKIVTGPVFANIDDLDFQATVTDLPCIEFIIGHVAVFLVVHPDSLVLPVGLIKGVKIIEEVLSPYVFGFGRIFYII